MNFINNTKYALRHIWLYPNESSEYERLFISHISMFLVFFGILSFILLVFVGIRAAYGRYSSKAWGFFIPASVAWMIQESPMIIWGLYSLHYANWQVFNLPARILFGVLFVHYINRTFVFPLRLKGGKPTPVSLMFAAIVFCTLNGFIQFRHLTQYANYEDSLVYRPYFIGGLLLCMVGAWINWHSDQILMNLRKGPHDKGYYIPRGGMFEYVSGANFFGEILQWTGWAIASGGHQIPMTFAIVTFCNIGPRGFQHHQNYLEKFKGEYPTDRKAVIPFVW